MAKVTSLKVILQAGSDSLLYASWAFSGTKNLKNLDSYNVYWYYKTGDGISYEGEKKTGVKDKFNTYSMPSNATEVTVKVAPVAKYKNKKKKKRYYTSEYVSATFKVIDSTPEQPNAPSLAIDKYKLTATLDGITDTRANQIEFYVVNGNSKCYTGVVNVATQRAIFTKTNITPGGKYRVKCRAINIVGSKKLYSDWSTFSSEETTIPTAPTNVKATVDSETSVKLTWTKVSNATGYKVEYTTEKKHFDKIDNMPSVTVTNTTAYITGLDSGKQWYFRVCATNDAPGNAGGWSSIVSAIIGTKPEAPTTWSSSTTAVVGDEVILYWVHNTEDASKQTGAQIKLIVNGKESTIAYTKTIDDDETVYSYALNLSAYTEGAEILWQIRTKGITNTYGDWSIQRKIKLNAAPSLGLQLSDASGSEMLMTFPFKMELTAGPASQTPIGYHVSIINQEAYETEDDIGRVIQVGAGTEVYSKVFNVNTNPLVINLMPSDVILENNQIYDVKATVTMDTGLTAEVTDSFEVSWSEVSYEPDAELAYDEDTLSMYITPFCEDENEELVSDVTLSVYRREFDGTFTEIASDIANGRSTAVTDPHPSLDYARYRIVATSTVNGSMGYTDLPGEPIGEPSIVIQWDEDWTSFDHAGEEEADYEIPPWTGSMVKLPYNISTSENHSPDISLVKYIGRSHPVSYYGTQRGESASWSTVIPKDDVETLYALRRLAVWAGDVYVREPSGVGYWAQITVSISQKHDDLTIPVSFDINRVEGGI